MSPLVIDESITSERGSQPSKEAIVIEDTPTLAEPLPFSWKRKARHLHLDVSDHASPLVIDESMTSERGSPPSEEAIVIDDTPILAEPLPSSWKRKARHLHLDVSDHGTIKADEEHVFLNPSEDSQIVIEVVTSTLVKGVDSPYYRPIQVPKKGKHVSRCGREGDA